MSLDEKDMAAIADISAKTTAATLEKKAREWGWEKDDAKDKEVVRKFTPGAGVHGATPDGIEVKKAEGDQPFKSYGEQLFAVKEAAYIAKGQIDKSIDPRLLGVHQKATGTSEIIPAEGGFLVAQEFLPTIINRPHNTGQIWAKVRKQEVGPNYNGFKVPMINEVSRADGYRLGGVQGYWLGEGGTLTRSKPGFRQISLELQKLICLCYCTDELLQDAVQLESFINMWFPEEFGFMNDAAIIAGDGQGKPLGILNSPAMYQVSKETNQVSATVVTQNILKMWQSCYAPSRATVEWFINQEVESQLDQLSLAVGTGGIPVYMSLNMGITEDGRMRLKGRPVNIIEQASALGTLGDIILFDPQQYMLGQKGAINMATSIHVQFITDETAFRWTYRCNGMPMWNSTLTPYKGSIRLSPIIALQSR
jgi:HK97 family phage major capsid protein